MVRPGRPRKIPVRIEEIPPPLSSSLLTTEATIEDRMMRYRNPSCVSCGAKFVVTEQKNREMAVYRCRFCGFRWEEIRR